MTPHFAAAVAAAVAAARRETWRQEQVVDWRFNVAPGVSLAAIATGLVGVLWVVGATAGLDVAPQLARSAVSALLDVARAQAPSVGTAALLLGTTVAAWWWAEERARWVTRDQVLAAPWPRETRQLTCLEGS